MASSDQSSWRSVPIPEIPSIEGRETVPIQECGEDLVPISTWAPTRLRVLPEYYLRGYTTATIECHVRRTVANMLLSAAEMLPEGYRLVVLDGWRPISLQREIYDEERKRQRTLDPLAQEEEIDRRTRVYVSIPSDDPDRPSPHFTGGAVDVTIHDEQHMLLHMGTGFDHFGPEAATRYYEGKLECGEVLRQSDQYAMEHRRLLYHAMTSAGFSSYREEWWHFDYGDQFWGRICRTHAIYGPSKTIPEA